MKHKRRQVLTAQLSFEQFEKQAYSVKIFTGMIFINLRNGLFGYQDDLKKVTPAYQIYQKARSVKNFNGQQIAKRSSKDQPLQLVKYKTK